MFQRVLASVLVLLLIAGGLSAQTSPAEKIRRQVGKIGTLGSVTVNMRDGRELYGNIRGTGAEDFTIEEVDQHAEITLRYADVSKVRSGYGNTRGISGRRIHPHTKLIVSLAVVGGLIALVFIAVASDHS